MVAMNAARPFVFSQGEADAARTRNRSNAHELRQSRCLFAGILSIGRAGVMTSAFEDAPSPLTRFPRYPFAHKNVS
jgi:hypothetical protein